MTSCRFVSRSSLESLDAVAQRYGARPSQIVGVADPLAAYDLDRACLLVGRAAEARVWEAARAAAQAPAGRPPAPRDGAVLDMDAHTLRGRVAVADDPAARAAIDRLFPETPITDDAPAWVRALTT